jgi:hypothetical protein
MFIKKNKSSKDILFYPSTKSVEEFIPAPSPSYLKNIPVWHRSLPKYLNNDKKFIFKDWGNLTAKSCLPLMDAFTSGYVFSLPFDIYTRKKDDGIRTFSWAYNMTDIPSPIVHREKENKEDLTGWNNMDGYEDLEFNWFPYWGIKTPPGYSCIFTHPINRIDLPFYTLGGVIDTDGWGTAGNQPFLIKKDWEGIIHAETPILQIIPFKRENWKNTVNKNLIDETLRNERKRDTFLQGFYKNKIWKNKFYR